MAGRTVPGPQAEPTCQLGVCDGSGWILGPEDIARPCECRHQRLHSARLRGVASVLPPRYRGVSFDRPPISDMARDLQTKSAVEEVREFSDDLDRRLAEGSGICLFGGVGTGKTTLAMLVSKTAIEAGRSVAIYSLPKLLARIRRTYAAEQGEDSYLAFFERLTEVDLLHVDDLGAEKSSDWVLEQLYALVNERYESQRSMIVTTNLEFKELEDQIGARTVSRLNEMCRPIPLFGEDSRFGQAA